MVENKLVIPDEMVHYLNQVADNQNLDTRQNTWQNQVTQCNNVQQNYIKPEEILQKPPNSINQPCTLNRYIASPSNQINHNSPMVNHGGMNQAMMPSPQMNMNQMMPSPASNYNPQPSPASNFATQPSPANNFATQPSPANNFASQQSPASNFVAQASPASNFATQPSPASNFATQPSPASNFATQPSPASNFAAQQSPASNFTTQPSPASNFVAQPSPASNFATQPSPANNFAAQQSPANNFTAQQSPASNFATQPSPANNYNAQLSPASNFAAQPSPGSNFAPQQTSATNYNQTINQSCNNQMISSSHMLMSPRSHIAQGMPSPNSQCRNNQSCNRQMCYNWNRCPKNEMCRQNQQCHMQHQYCNNENNHVCQYNYKFCQHNRIYPSMHSPNMCNQISEPLTSPAVATTAPIDQMGPPQTAQMSRPCIHNYDQQQQQQQNFAYTSHNCVKGYQNKMCYHQNEGIMEIQCKDISQSQISPGVQQNTNMRHDTYQRTLEYVQNCQSWVGHSDTVSSSTHPLMKCGQDTSNMIINDMSSSLTSLLEENRYLQMIQ